MGPRASTNGGKSRPTGIRSPDRPARSSVAIPTELPGPQPVLVEILNMKTEAKPSSGFALSRADRRAIGPTEVSSLAIAFRNCFVNSRKNVFVIVSEYIVVSLTGSSKSKCSQSVRLRCLYRVRPVEFADLHLCNT